VERLIRASGPTQEGYYGLAAQAAAANRHAEIVDLMLSVGADLNAVDGYYGSPL
jgi:hypothetical protein